MVSGAYLASGATYWVMSAPSEMELASTYRRNRAFLPSPTPPAAETRTLWVLPINPADQRFSGKMLWTFLRKINKHD